MELEKIKVSDIEYNTELGSRCQLLQERGIDTYSDTEENIYNVLSSTEGDIKSFEICKRYSRCGYFLECFQHGETPCTSKDPIRLIEFGGKYWVKEGKHRVCLAKRAKIETIEAQVSHLPKNCLEILPPVGEPGCKVFRATYKGKKRKGKVAILWTKPPADAPSSLFSFHAVALNVPQFCGKDKMEIFSGLSYRRSVSSSLFGGTSITVEVEIGENRPNTKIWLYTLPADGNGEIETVFRCGRWKNYHQHGVYGFQSK